jgi:hypothetical protein
VISVFQVQQTTAYPVADVVHQVKYIDIAPAGST